MATAAEKKEEERRDAFLAAVESAGMADRVELARELVSLLQSAEGARQLLGIVRAPIAAARPMLGLPGVTVDGLDVETADAILAVTEPFVTVRLAESGSTRTARATSAVSSSVDGLVVASGKELPKKLSRNVEANSSSSWNSARWAILNKIAPDKNDPERGALATVLDAWIADDMARAASVDLPGHEVTVQFIQ